MKLTDNMGEEDHFIFHETDQNILNAMEHRKGKPILVPIALEKKTKTQGYIRENKLYLEGSVKNWAWPIAELVLQGDHNLINSLAATMAATLAGVPLEKAGPALKSFVNAAHRMEFVAEIDGIKFVNDSKGTNVDATAFALSAYKEPLVWIAGGVDKGNDYSSLDEKVKDHVKVLICLGKENEKLKIAFSGKIPIILYTQDIREAVKWALDYGKPGDIALLSPACASFDLFNNYEDRGDQFKNAVNQFKEQ
jgi:UDP-N-acetylmuramoylalanine--D-glutamate ligase